MSPEPVPTRSDLATPPRAVELNHWMLESSPDCVKVLEPDGRLVAMNRNGLCVMEIDDFAPLCGAPWPTLWPQAGHAQIQAALERAREGGTGHFTAFCPTAKGTPKWWDVRVTPILGEDGRVERLLAVSRDVTELHRSREELEEAAQRLRFVLAAAELGEWDLDLQTGLARHSAQHDRCFGYAEPLERWDIETLLRHVHPGDREACREGFAAALREGRDWRTECRVVWPDGSTHWIALQGGVYRRVDGRPARMLGIVADITARKRAEALATGQKRVLELAVAGAPLAEILDTLTRSAEEQAGGVVLSSVLLLDEDGRHLRHGAAPSLPEAYSHAVDGLEIGPATGSCGTAAYLGEPVIASDIETDPRWTEGRVLALPHGLRACWSQPILSSGGRVLGTVASYCRDRREPTPQERESTALLANTAALVLERHREVEERRAAEQALRDSEERFRSLVTATSAIVWTTPASGEFEAEQPSWSAFTGQDFAALRGWGWLDAVHPEDRAETAECWRRALHERSTLQLEHRLRGADGGYRHMNVRAVPIVSGDAGVREWVGIHTDITDRKQAELHFRDLATHDTLTGLPNRSYLHEHLQELLEFTPRDESIALMLIDLDRFKQVNDSLGHDAGDALLVEVARRFRSVTRPGDLVARLGGDEFVVAAHCAGGRACAQAVAQKLLDALDAPISVAGHEVRVGASIGASLYPEHGRSKEELFQHSDIAMYRAKGAGRNCFRFFAEEMSVAAKQRLMLEMSLRGALERGEFLLHYQPRLQLPSLQPVGVEALVRWNHPEQGLIAPQRFIPIAEETGMIEALGIIVLRQACRDAVELGRRLGHPLQVSVNLSPQQLKSQQLVRQVEQALHDSGLQPPLLELELTENAFIDDMEASAQTLRALKELGVKLAVDDFGTGFSGISYLRRFPIDTVKLDRTFLSQPVAGVSRDRFIKALSDMAHALNLQVVAEGVEDEQTLKLLQWAASDEVQGYLFAAPLAMDEVAHYLAARRDGPPRAVPGLAPVRIPQASHG